MAIYYVRDTFGNETTLEADYYNLAIPEGVFDFYSHTHLTEDGDDATVATFVREAVTGIVLEDALLEETGEDENLAEDGDCPGCPLEEFLDSQEFFDAVAEIVQLFVPDEDDKEDVPGSPAPAPEKPLDLKVLTGVRKDTGETDYGFLTPDGFVYYPAPGDSDPSDTIEGVINGIRYYLEGSRNWSYKDPGIYFNLTEVSDV
jgi:hypothetical protein